jgi:hypothetical protein
MELGSLAKLSSQEQITLLRISNGGGPLGQAPSSQVWPFSGASIPKSLTRCAPNFIVSPSLTV